MTELVTVEASALDALTQKLERLTTQVEFLTEEAQRQKRRQQEWDELKNDLIPIGNEQPYAETFDVQRGNLLGSKTQ